MITYASPRARPPAWTFDASVVLAIVVVTGVGAWAFRRARSAVWLAGAMAATLVAIGHTLVPFHAPVPPTIEFLALFGASAILLGGSVVDR